MPRFVILRHEPASGSSRALHWDLMLESGGVLRTWELPGEPAVGATFAARRLDDHRIAYLDYEGPISDNRGAVSRWDRGEFTTIDERAAMWLVQLEGQRLRGRLRLTAPPADEPAEDAHWWTVSFSS